MTTIKYRLLLFAVITLLLSDLIIVVGDIFTELDGHCLTIENSCTIWAPKHMKLLAEEKSLIKYGVVDVPKVLNRSYTSIYFEWWLHNIGYHITKPLCFNNKIKKINQRCKDVDLEKWE